MKKLRNNASTKRADKEISSTKRMKQIQELIKLRRSDMKLLIAFAIGEKTLPARYKCKRHWERTEEDDKLLLWTLRQLREQIHELDQTLSLLQRGRA